MKRVIPRLVAAPVVVVRPSARAGRFLSLEKPTWMPIKPLAGLRFNLRLTRKPEHLLTDDIALDLRSATPDCL